MQWRTYIQLSEAEAASASTKASCRFVPSGISAPTGSKPTSWCGPDRIVKIKCCLTASASGSPSASDHPLQSAKCSADFEGKVPSFPRFHPSNCGSWASRGAEKRNFAGNSAVGGSAPCIKDGFVPTSSLPLGEKMGRQEAEILFSTAC